MASSVKPEWVQHIQGGVSAPQGFTAVGLHCGIKRKRNDLALLFSNRPAAAAGTFTTNKVKAAPVLLSQARVANGWLQAVVVNSGNANACNGDRGMADAKRMCEITAQALGISVDLVAVGSTGVIGQPLPMDKVEAGIRQAARLLSPNGGASAAEAIMTTDTRPKEIAITFELSGQPVRIGGMAKGSGMIHPNMATMLAYITTDVAIEPELLRLAVCRAVDNSFNAISVDGDTSTNDTVLVLANGNAGNPVLQSENADFARFAAALEYVCITLAKEIARDGEGATKLIEIRVRGAQTRDDARKAAKAVANSNLVKTAIYGEDANWGRIFCACGYSGAEFDPAKVSIFLGDVQVAAAGTGLPFDEARARTVLQASEVVITIDFGQGDYTSTVWTCDLTYDYIKVNASYRS